MNRRDLIKWAVATALAAPLAARAFLRLGGGISADGMTFDYYISPTGSDSNAGTVASPWAITSLQDTSPNNARIASKRVGLLPGTYNLSSLQSGSNPNNYAYPILNLPPGSADSPTYLGSSDANGNYEPRTATLYIDSTNTTGNFVLGQDQELSGYFTIDGIVIDAGSGGTTTTVGFSPSLIVLYPAEINGGVTIQNCEIRNVYTALTPGDNYAAIVLSGASGGPPIGTVITNNYFHNIYRSNQTEHTHAIETLTSCTAPVITYNTFININAHIDFKYNTVNGNVSYNYFGPTYEGLALQGFDGNGLTQENIPNAVHHNVFDGCGSTIGVDVESQFLQNLNFYNNTIYDARTSSNTCTIYLNIGGSGNTVNSYNNIVVSNVASGYVNGGIYGANQFTVENYNCFAFASTTNGWEVNGTLLGTLEALQDIGGSPDANSIGGGVSFPQFASSITVGNGPTQFQLGASSPCLGAGRTGGTSGGSAVNMGAMDGTGTPGCSFA